MRDLMDMGKIIDSFIEIQVFNESPDFSPIRTVRREDVTSKHFIDWFFKMQDEWWTNMPPKEFPFDYITHCQRKYVYGYFNGENLDSIIRADKVTDGYGLSFFFTNKNYQNQGMGQTLFQFILKRFAAGDLTLNVYTDNERAIHIYSKYGFQIVKTKCGLGYRNEAPYHIMKKYYKNENEQIKVGSRVRVIENGVIWSGMVGYVEKINNRQTRETSFHVRFPNGKTASFYESNVRLEPLGK
jgi:ribosomal protein S18 acetylase RimI-like enzyme